jgi:hypothetical protein
MSPDLVVMGVDPGPIPGVAVLEYGIDDAGVYRLIEANALQVSHGLAATVATALIDQHTRGVRPPELRVAVERFVVGGRSARSGTAKAGEQTRDLIGELRHVADVSGCWFIARSASEVKPWASDDRLAKAGLMACTHQMRHSRDAARHALFAAVKDGRVPDPLSKGANR